MTDDSEEKNKNQNKHLSDEEFMNQLKKQNSDVKQMFLDYEENKNI